MEHGGSSCVVHVLESHTVADEPGAIGEAHHTGLSVGNLERSIAFYRDLLGMTLVGQQDGTAPYLSTITGFPSVRLRQAFLKANPSATHVLELLEYISHPSEPIPAGTNRPGSAHLCFRVPDIRALHERLSSAGVPFVSPPEPVTHGVNTGALACYLRDPDGFTVELFQPPPPERNSTR